MASPNLVQAEGFKPNGVHASTLARLPGSNEWVFARGLGDGRLWTRVKLAYGVLTGKYDALQWGCRQ